MVISGKAEVQDFSCFSISVADLLGWGKQMTEEITRVSKMESARGNVLSLGHMKLEAPRGLRRKFWINTFGAGLGDLTQEKHRMLRR